MSQSGKGLLMKNTVWKRKGKGVEEKKKVKLNTYREKMCPNQSLRLMFPVWFI